MSLVLLVLLILILIGVFPAWPHSRDYGYYPASGVGLVVIVILILLVLGRI